MCACVCNNNKDTLFILCELLSEIGFGIINLNKYITVIHLCIHLTVLYSLKLEQTKSYISAWLKELGI